MSNLPNPPKTINPLWIIFMFFSFMEIVLGVAVFNTTGGIQVALTVFVIGFPLLVAIGFFIVVWSRPEHLYAPKDFGDDSKFLQGLESSRTARENLIKLQEKIKKSESSITAKDLDKLRKEILSQLDKTLYALDPTSALIYIPKDLQAEQRRLKLFGFNNFEIYERLKPSMEGIVIFEVKSAEDEINFRNFLKSTSPQNEKTAFILYANYAKHRIIISDETIQSYENLYVSNMPVTLANMVILALRTLVK